MGKGCSHVKEKRKRKREDWVVSQLKPQCSHEKEQRQEDKETTTGLWWWNTLMIIIWPSSPLLLLLCRQSNTRVETGERKRGVKKRVKVKGTSIQLYAFLCLCVCVCTCYLLLRYNKVHFTSMLYLLHPCFIQRKRRENSQKKNQSELAVTFDGLDRLNCLQVHLNRFIYSFSLSLSFSLSRRRRRRRYTIANSWFFTCFQCNMKQWRQFRHSLAKRNLFKGQIIQLNWQTLFLQTTLLQLELKLELEWCLHQRCKRKRTLNSWW